ncbi:RNA-binding protein Mcp2 [Schizosaccharomyces japonicus yFS275]|uniref:RNA-binding protein Mcp2 n=1 Tax=Schizosaccharomyces japonicus (strain yFS275 / FY16936) TaxID=402676 RepID=B6JWI4_SCHJY|nr:RNA-binding protein Mcp2 [Schizosaccharomyces japonicus yFS275]EEB05735.2 RNA-binding protein Mcp2 [Schizosaccharomyces japonicus yFS275]
MCSIKPSGTTTISSNCSNNAMGDAKTASQRRLCETDSSVRHLTEELNALKLLVEKQQNEIETQRRDLSLKSKHIVKLTQAISNGERSSSMINAPHLLSNDLKARNFSSNLLQNKNGVSGSDDLSLSYSAKALSNKTNYLVGDSLEVPNETASLCGHRNFSLEGASSSSKDPVSFISDHFGRENCFNPSSSSGRDNKLSLVSVQNGFWQSSTHAPPVAESPLSNSLTGSDTFPFRSRGAAPSVTAKPFSPQLVSPRGFGKQLYSGTTSRSNAFEDHFGQSHASTNSPNHMKPTTNLRAIWNGNATPETSVEDPVLKDGAAKYRKLSERNAVYDWKQKLKVAAPAIKHSIIDTILEQAYPLMLNRFGNFLVQRCFEHGWPQHVRAIGETILGHALQLATDPFGCHVVQKALDNVTEDIKLAILDELFVHIGSTITHHYACHVWQKLFEVRWSECGSNLMTRVNDALRGKWAEIALGENGSLVVQNMFENCVEEDKRECIEEVISNLDTIARGQWGNWVIQHMLENGHPKDLDRVTTLLLAKAADYSVDQYASKVIEKAIKIGSNNFIPRYLTQVTTTRVNRTRQPLVDIASDQYGNYLVQQILQVAQPQEKEVVVRHIKKHMVSLRGSKYGQKVAFMVEKLKNQTFVNTQTTL